LGQVRRPTAQLGRLMHVPEYGWVSGNKSRSLWSEAINQHLLLLLIRLRLSGWQVVEVGRDIESGLIEESVYARGTGQFVKLTVVHDSQTDFEIVVVRHRFARLDPGIDETLERGFSQRCAEAAGNENVIASLANQPICTQLANQYVVPL